MSDRIEPLQWDTAERLARWVCEEDRKDLFRTGGDPEEALKDACTISANGHGQAWFWERDDFPTGAFGWTRAGAIWSVWSDLLPDARKDMMKATPRFIRAMVRDAGRPLGNLVWENNRRVLAWLRSSHCFDIYLDNTVRVGEDFYVPFQTRPLEDLRNV